MLAGDLALPRPIFSAGRVNTVKDLSDNGIARKELETEDRRLKQENKRLGIEREILKKAAAFFCERVELRYDFIRQEKKACPVTIPCQVMEVSRSGFYRYCNSLKKLMVLEIFY
jgi:hypothetical protein